MNDKGTSVVRGRPKGSTDTVPRKKRTDKKLLNDNDNDKGANSKITLHEVKIMKQPKIDLNERSQIEKRIEWYFNECITDDIKPGVAGLCLALGISRQAWQSWGCGKYRDYTDIVEKSRQVMEAILEQYMLQGKVNPVTGMFLMKNNFHYVDKNEVTIEPRNPLGDTVDAEQLKQKYLESAYNSEEYGSDLPKLPIGG